MAIKFIWLGCSLGGAARSFRLMSARADWSTCPGLRLFLSTIVVERSAPIINPLEIAGELQSSFTGEKYGRNISLRSVGVWGRKLLNFDWICQLAPIAIIPPCLASRLKGSFRIYRKDEKSYFLSLEDRLGFINLFSESIRIRDMYADLNFLFKMWLSYMMIINIIFDIIWL